MKKGNEQNNEKKRHDKKVTFAKIVTQEYAWEKYLVLILGFAFLLFAAWLGMGLLEVKEVVKFFGDGTQKIFMWTFVGIGLIAIIIALWDQIVSSVKEMKKVTPPTAFVMAELTVKVFVFIIVLALIIFGLDTGLSSAISALRNLVK